MLAKLLKSLFIIFVLGQASALTFEQWKNDYAKRATKRGLNRSFVLKILADVKLDKEVIEKDRNQVIFAKERDYNVFIKRWLREGNKRATEAKMHLQQNLPLLNKVEKKYGVDKEVIVALWGVETFFGKITGDFDVIRSLATLAFEGRRRKFYEVQLNAILRLIKAGHITQDKIKGSWAGATGQCQFMPSNIPVYGQDFNGDGRIDIWNSKEDIFASIAYLLKKAGWKKGKSIGSLAINTKSYTGNLEKYRSRWQYNDLGFRKLNGELLKSKKWYKRKASTIPMKNSPVVLRGTNYRPLLRWNNSSLFAAFNILLIEEMKK